MNSTNSNQRIWAVGGGKGGIGKSIIATNIAIVLANQGKNVVAIDLDLGNGNMHSNLGIKYPKNSILDFIEGHTDNLNELITDTSIFNLKLICGSGGIVGAANPWHSQKLKLLRHIEKLNADHIVLDLGAGTTYNTIDFFLGATDHIVVTTPDTPAIQSAFNFIRICIFRKLYSIVDSKDQAWVLLEKAKTPTMNSDGQVIRELMAKLEELEPENIRIFGEFLREFKPHLIMNMVLKQDEAKLGHGIAEVVKRYLNVDLNYAGNISFDNIIRESLAQETPYIIYAPKSKPTNEFMAMVPEILNDTSNVHGTKEIAQREIRRLHKTYAKRVVESSADNVDPSIYVTDKLRKIEVETRKESSGIFNIRATSWSKLAIDLGTSFTRIFVKNRGIVLNEPSLMSIDTSSGKIVALGTEAKAMMGRSHPDIKVVSPMEAGAITDYSDVKMMIQEFIRIAKRSTIVIRPGVVLTIPPVLTQVEKRAVDEFVKELGAREVHLVYAPMAAAIGAGLPVDIPSASMIVDVGGGSTSALVISISGIVEATSERVGGNTIDNTIIRYLRDRHNFLVGEQTAEWIKINYAQAHKIGRDSRFQVRGQDLANSIPRTFSISTGEIREAISRPVHDILKVIANLLEKVPPELSGDLVDRGMTLTGGSAYLQGLDKAITLQTGIKVRIAPNARTAAVEGAGRMLDDFNLYRKFFVDEADTIRTRD